MELAERIRSFELLGEHMARFHEDCPDSDLAPLVTAAKSAFLANPWFTPEHIRYALNSMGESLSGENLSRWLSAYPALGNGYQPLKRVGVVMAGNIPVVGFHDLLCVLISGHKILTRLSSSDDKLMPALAEILTSINSGWKERITFVTGKLEQFDAIIATGSNNTSRYFEYYFGKYPNIIRRHRSSVAVLDGTESPAELSGLADDVMRYFGLGCRSVSKLYVPKGYDLKMVLQALSRYKHYSGHNKFMNNYEYVRSIFLVSNIPYTDGGFFLLKEDASHSSRIALINCEYYNSIHQVISDLDASREELQCVVTNLGIPEGRVKFGEAQKPALWDYADGVDTMSFLLNLSR